jgi:hypothetical protein
MGIFGAFKDYKKYKKVHNLSQLLYPSHPNLWTDRIVKLPDNSYAGASGKLIYNEETHPYAVYTEFEDAIEKAKQLGYSVVDA